VTHLALRKWTRRSNWQFITIFSCLVVFNAAICCFCESNSFSCPLYSWQVSCNMCKKPIKASQFASHAGGFFISFDSVSVSSMFYVSPSVLCSFISDLRNTGKIQTLTFSECCIICLSRQV
jgi:hypothetical protein